MFWGKIYEREIFFEVSFSSLYLRHLIRSFSVTFIKTAAESRKNNFFQLRSFTYLLVELLATKIQGVFLKYNDKDAKFWTECVNREFIILSLFFPVAMFPFIHITIDLLRDQFLFISAAVDSLLIQLVTFHEFRIQTTPTRFSERNWFEQINIHQEAAIKRSTTKLKCTVLQMYV